MKFRSTAMIVVFIGAVVVLARGQAAQQQPRPQMAEEVFKNVQVLKGIPVDEFMDTMGMFSAALSLNCIDCHTAESVGTWDRFADETPLKQTARRMVQMVNELNRVSFKGVRSVTCYTCHHGDLRPKMVPNLAAQYATPVEDPNEIEVFRLPGGPSADQVFEKYLQALGGPQRLAALTSFAGKGTYIGFETEQTKVPVEVFAKAPLQRSTVVHMTVGDKVTLYDGRAAWIAGSDKPIPLMSLTGGNLDGAKIDALVAFPAQIKQAFSQWQVGATAIDDREVQVLRGTNPRQSPVNFYFDQSGLLVRVVRFVDTAVGRVPTQIDYSDYREVSGVKIPFKWTVTWTNGQSTTELSEVQGNVSIDAARFSRPAPARPPK
jgi:photosynthetic reaction center cytochrome c subunit